MRYIILLPVLALLAACASQPVHRNPATPLPVATIEMGRYLGMWREAARLPNRFERDCVGASAEYRARADGLISVRNVCLLADGSQRDVVGRARRVGEGEEGKLKVSFFGPFWGDYWVIERADDYSWSIVGEPSGRHLWVLTRAQSVSPGERTAFEARLHALGYDVAAVVWNER